jgi:hypothetical protein
MWYYDDKEQNYTISEKNLLIAMNLDIAVRPVYLNAERLKYSNRSSYWSVYHIFSDDGTVYQYPLLKSPSDAFVRQKPVNETCKTLPRAGDARCSAIYQYAQKFSENGKVKIFPIYTYNCLNIHSIDNLNKEVVMFAKPYLHYDFKNESYSQPVLSSTACALVRNSTNLQSLFQVTCIDFGLAGINL